MAVWLRFRLRSGSAGLFEDKKRCGMVEEDRCVLCNGGKVEDVKHFVVGIVGAEEWVKGRVIKKMMVMTV